MELSEKLKIIKENNERISNIRKTEVEVPEEIKMLYALGLSSKNTILEGKFRQILGEELIKFFQSNKSKRMIFLGGPYEIEEKSFEELLKMNLTIIPELPMKGTRNYRVTLVFNNNEKNEKSITFHLDEKTFWVKEYIQYMLIRPAMVATFERFFDFILELQNKFMFYVSSTGADEKIVINQLDGK